MLDLIGIHMDKGTAWGWLFLAMAIGFVLIIYGGKFFVDSAIWLSKTAKIPPMIIGATIVSIGTTLPEICVSIMAAAKGDSGIALGNATGSPLFNGTVILGVVLAFSVTQMGRRQFAPKAFFVALSITMLALFIGINGSLSIFESIILLAVFAAFIGYSIYEAKVNPMPQLEEESVSKQQKPWLMVLLFILGAAGIAFGANCLVDGLSAAAYKINVSGQVVGMTVAAVGTSLPELVTAITSLKKKNAALSIGNILGANIINITLICGLCGLIGGEASLAGADYWGYMIAVAGIVLGVLILMLPLLIKKRTYKWQGYSLLIIYVAYLGYLITSLVI